MVMVLRTSRPNLLFLLVFPGQHLILLGYIVNLKVYFDCTGFNLDWNFPQLENTGEISVVVPQFIFRYIVNMKTVPDTLNLFWRNMEYFFISAIVYMFQLIYF